MKKKFYITTPIYYPNARLHIGHAYTTVAADALARYHRLLGEEVFFLTGTDEHGQKIARTAQEAGLSPQQYVDQIVATIRELWATLAISCDDFIRTSEDRHRAVVQDVFRRLQASGDVYKGTYEGWYCTPDESFWPEGRLVDGKCPVCGRPVERVREESYFLRLEPYAKRLRQHILDHPEFIQPESRRNEMLAFIDSGLDDLSISRTSFDWGVPLPGDETHVAYVWIDALTNYITAAGFGSDPDRFARLWPADVHLVGKEIVRFHAIIWPIILLALKLPLPKTVFGHGWLLLDDAKIGKSSGNVIEPTALVERYGLDAVRYYLLREVAFGSDGSYSEPALILRTNVDLANDLGNLLSRTTAMLERFSAGTVPAPSGQSILRPIAEAAIADCEQALANLSLSDALVSLFRLVRAANKSIEDEAPWTLHRSQNPRLGTVLYDLAESLRVTAVALRPFLIDAPGKIYAQLGAGDISATSWKDTAWGGLKPGATVQRGAPLFPRIEDTDAAPSAPGEGALAARPEKATKERASDERAGVIAIDDFKRLQLRVARVLSAEPVAGSRKLLKLTLDLGGEQRTVVSGIAAHYEGPQLVGKDVILLANLAPATIFGIESGGMILAAKDADHLRLLTVDGSIEPGSPVS